MTDKTVKETTEYDNCLDIATRTDDEYGLSLDKFLGENDSKPVDQTKAKKKKDCFKEIYVHFENGDNLIDFCERVGWSISRDKKFVFYPHTTSPIDPKVILPKEKIEDDVTLESFLDEKIDDEKEKWREYWKGMPEYNQPNNPPYRSLTVKFKTKEDMEKFADVIDQDVSEKTKSIWHPKLQRTKNFYLRWIVDIYTPNKYPVYIVSKGRYDSMITSQSLNRMEVPHYIVIEPQEEEQYKKALEVFNITHAILLVAPFSNHGDGPGRARNWAWDHAITLGAKRHWVLDDNISDFYRLHNNIRIRVESPVFFKVMEDFVDRYENIPIAGPQYRFFIAPDQKYPPLVLNTRIYSCLLIDNECKHRWRGRYNEDTDICLRVLKDGDVTVQFNAFLQGKAATQTVAGGNTMEFYHAEGNLEKENWIDKRLNSEGTINKSQMLVDMHPDVTRMVFRYGRWHHWVDYDPFKKNKPILRADAPHLEGSNNYGMRLIEGKEVEEWLSTKSLSITS